MFQATATEVLVLKTLSRLSDSDSNYIEESVLLEKFKEVILKQVQNDRDYVQNDRDCAQNGGDCVQNAGYCAQNGGDCAKDGGSGLRTLKNALSGCAAKGFVQKSEQGGKTFYKITEDGRKQI